MKIKLLPIMAIIILSALFLAACGGSAEPTYAPEDKGLPNLGKDLTTSEYVSDNTDEVLLTLLKEGRPSGHELNTTGVDMPPKGGNPSLSDEDLMTIVAYLRSINQ